MADDTVDPRTFNVPLTKGDALAMLVRVYGLAEARAAVSAKSETKLPPSDARLLALLRQRGGEIMGTQAALAKELGVHASTVSKSFARLSKRGLVRTGRGIISLSA